MSSINKTNSTKKEIRVCYDMVHFGHANQLRQAKTMGTYLVVGVHNDHDITVHKGPPVFNESERYRMVRGIKWVDEIVENAPYETSVEFLDRYNCDFCVHGSKIFIYVKIFVDDITLTADGQDTYAEVKRLGRYRECERTPGDLVGRMLLLTKSHHTNHDGELNSMEHRERARSLSTDHGAQSPWTRISRFLPSTKTIMEFSEGKSPLPTDRVVYVCGSFDLFHIGHLSFLEEARKLGDYLVVGIYNDQVVIDAPYSVSQELIDRFHISVVVQGCHTDHHSTIDGVDCYALPKKLGIYQTVDSGNDMTTEKIIDRIINNKYVFYIKLNFYRIQFEKRNKQKEKKEIASYNALQKLKANNTQNQKSLTEEVICIPSSN